MNNSGLSTSRVIGLVVSRWKILLLTVILVVGAAYSYEKFVAQPVYQSTAQVTYQAPSRDNPTGSFLPSSGVTREDIATLIANTGSAKIVDQAAKTAGVTPKKLRESVSVRAAGDAAVIDFQARSGDPEEAQKMANAYAEAFVADRRRGALANVDRQIKAKQKQLAGLGKMKFEDPNQAFKSALAQQISELQTQREQWGDSIQVSNQARIPDHPEGASLAITLIAAMIVGLGLGIGVALVAATTDRKVRADHADELPAPVLIKVPRAKRAPKSAPLGPSLAESVISDAFAALGARIMLDKPEKSAHVVLVTSARSGEGKSSVASNLASALAQGGRRVVLIDADMRRPVQHQVFPSLNNRPGLSHILSGAIPVEQALTLIAPHLAGIASGPTQGNASVLLASVAFRTLIDRLAEISDVVIVDAPPALAVTDALAIAPAATQVLLIARIGVSNQREIEEAYAKVARASSTPQAMVLVGADRPTGYGYETDLPIQPVAYPGANPDTPDVTRKSPVRMPTAPPASQRTTTATPTSTTNGASGNLPASERGGLQFGARPEGPAVPPSGPVSKPATKPAKPADGSSGSSGVA